MATAIESSVKQWQAFVALVLAISLTFTSHAETSAPKPQIATLRRGQVLVLSLLTPLDSSRAQVGDEVSLELKRPLTSDGVTVLPAGWAVHTRIASVTRAGKRNCKPGRITWKLHEVSTPDGRKFKVQPIPQYIAAPPGNVPLDRVVLDSRWKKVGTGADSAGKALAGLPLVILFLPLEILIFIGMWNDCDGSPGMEERIPPGSTFYAVVAKNVRVTIPQ